MAKGKKKANWVLIIAVMFILGGIMTLIEKIKESAHPALFTVLIVVGLAAVAVCVFLILRHAKKKKDAAIDSIDIPDRAVPDSELKMANIDTTPLPSAEPVKPAETYEFYRVKTVGVTFNNDDGTSRQELIRKLYYHEPPFANKEIELALEEYEYRGEPAFKVLADGYQLGNLSRADAKYMEENKDRCVTLCGAEIVGGDKPKDEYSFDDYDYDDDDDNDPLDFLHLDDFDDDYDDDYDDNYADDDDDYTYDRKPLTWGFHFNIKFKR